MGGKGSGRKPTAQCGTYAGYQRHKRLRQDACLACMEAQRDYIGRTRGARPKPKVRVTADQYRQNNNNYTKRRRAAQKSIINEWKLAQGQCADCGWQITPHNLPAIHCDHIDPTHKRYSISEQAGSIPFKSLHLELNKCQARCANCHALRTMEEGHWYHHNDPPLAGEQPARLFDQVEDVG
jgi:hypothetical protein